MTFDLNFALTVVAVVIPITAIAIISTILALENKTIALLETTREASAQNK